MYKVKQNGKTKIFATIKANMPTPQTTKKRRLTYKQIAERNKRIARDNRMLKAM